MATSAIASPPVRPGSTTPQSAQTTATPVLGERAVLDRLRAGVHPYARDYYRAMYSSLLGGVVTDPALMARRPPVSITLVIPLDDHMVHRGHAVFDTAIVTRGHAYQLDAHVDRFLTSATAARIPLPEPRAALRSRILATIAASGCRDGMARYWLSAGPGGFGLSPKECTAPSFHVIMTGESKPPPDVTVGARVVTASARVPIKPPVFATVKSTNYLPNALMLMEAQDAGADQGIWLDGEGNVGEGPNMNVAFVSPGGELLVPPFDAVLAGTTVQRVVALASPLVDAGSIPGLTRIRVGPVGIDAARAALEMMLIGSGTRVTPVTAWDGRPIGTGKVGGVALALRALLDADMADVGGGQHTKVEYGDA